MNFIKAINVLGFGTATVMFVSKGVTVPKDLLKKADIEQLIDLYLVEFELGGFESPQEGTLMYKTMIEIQKRTERDPNIKEYVLSEIENV